MDGSHVCAELAKALPQEEANELAQRIMGAVRAPTTLGVYAPIVKQYLQFRGASTIPHSSSVFAFMAKYYLGKSSFRTAAAALRLHFVASGVTPNPLDSEAMSLLRPAAEREKSKPTHRAKWATEDLVTVAKTLNGLGTAPYRRFRAFLLMNFSAYLRPSEGTALEAADVSFVDDQMLVSIAKTKTNQNGPAQTAIVDSVPTCEACPVKAIKGWLMDPARKNSRWVFPNLNDVTKPVKVSLMQSTLRDLVQKGLVPKGLTLHGLRGGATTACIEAGIPIDAVQRAGRWASTNSMKPYVAVSTRSLHGASNAIAAGLLLSQDATHPSSSAAATSSSSEA